MRLNKYLASATGMSRRAADQAISDGRVTINGQPAMLGAAPSDTDEVALDGQRITPAVKSITIMLNKPVGYVCSRDGQGSQTVYDLLPLELHSLKPVGRLDKNSSGLLLLTNDGQLANELTHPRYSKEKTYEVTLNKPLDTASIEKLRQGVPVEDYVSHLRVNGLGNQLVVKMSEGKNRQIRKTFEALGYTVTKLHRTQFGPYKLERGPAVGKYADAVLDGAETGMRPHPLDA